MEHRELFRTQLRAALRASVYGNLWLMIPMIGSLDDIRRAKEALAEVRAELDAERIPYSGDVKFGIMIEVPAIALIADKVAQEVDFASVGTNDLCQYLTAADRGNPGVAQYYQSYHPALFRVLRYVSECFQQAQKPLSVCGELGGDRLAAPVLAGMGFQKLSMPLSSLPYVKQALAGRTMPQLQSLAEAVCASATAEEAENCMR
jgi:phosphotransferase system enzyme I (PtsI)